MKQINKTFLLNKIFPLFLLTFVVVSQLFFVGVGSSGKAEAADLQCTYNDAAGSGDTRNATAMAMALTPIANSSGNQIGTNGKIDVRYAAGNPNPGGVDYNNSPTICSPSNVQAYVTIDVVGALSNTQVSNKIPLKSGYTITNENDTNNKPSLRLQGEFTIPNLKDSGLNINNLTGYTKTNGKTYDTVLTFHTTENGKDKTPYLNTGRPEYDANRTLKLYVCSNATLICADSQNNGNSNTGDPTTTNDLQIRLSLLKLAMRAFPAAASKSMVPDSEKTTPTHRFLRTYLDSNGKIASFTIDAFVIPAAPPDKTLYINSNGKSSSVIIGDSSNPIFKPKQIVNIGAQIFNKTILYSSPTDFGCIKADFSTSYLIGNENVAYNQCNGVTHQEVDGGLSIKTDGSTGQNFALTLDDTKIKQINASKPVVCKDPKTGEGCNEVLNVFQVGPSLMVNQNVTEDSTWTSFIARLPSVVGSYILARKGLLFSYEPADFYIEIYPSKAAFDKHVNDPVPAAVPEAKDVVSSAQVKDQSAAASLYAFIIRVISNIIVWLQSIIYSIFALILVPVIKALLLVRPYQDVFVNVIYPGWLILRNLANIFFIVSLLVVGLRILFQQSAAGTARSFIIRLLLMALLVNFSLVISQGLVGIADTVQSQFFPADSRVLEALGSKLMVEPLKAFRTDVAGSNETFNDKNSETSLAQTVKPLVLLMLSVAAFFSFAAIAAFLAVRLVVLWVLYMVSPIAYVGFVMDETKGYAKQWWKEFLKYLILTPVLAFFLNIAALMATVFAGENNKLFHFSDSLTGDIVANGLTVATHFIVLFFIFAGMKFALSSGTIGSKAIVDYAQKGFNNVLKTWPLAGKDMLTNMAGKKLEKEGYGSAAKVLTAAMKPLDFGRAVKKAQWDDKGEERKKKNQARLDDTFLTRSSAMKKDSLKEWKEKEKELNEDNKGALAEMLEKSIKSGDKNGAGAAMLRLSKNNDFDEVLSGIQEGLGNGVKYSKNAAGLNKATKDLQKKLGFTDQQRKDVLSNFDRQAGKEKDKRHYSGNVEFKKGSGTTIKPLVENDPSGSFSTTAAPDSNGNESSTYRDWVEGQVKPRSGVGVADDVNQSGVDSMVVKDANGHATRFTDTQLGVFSRRGLNQLTIKAGQKFRESGSKADALLEAYRNNRGLDGLTTSMIAYNQNVAPVTERLSEDAIREKARAIHRYIMTDEAEREENAARGGGNGGGGGNQPRNRAGFTARPVVVAAGPNPTNPNPTNAVQADQAQRVNDTPHFVNGQTNNQSGDQTVIGAPQMQPGFADVSDVTPEGSVDKIDRKRVVGMGQGSVKTTSGEVIHPESTPRPASSIPPTISPQNPLDAAGRAPVKDDDEDEAPQ